MKPHLYEFVRRQIIYAYNWNWYNSPLIFFIINDFPFICILGVCAEINWFQQTRVHLIGYKLKFVLNKWHSYQYNSIILNVRYKLHELFKLYVC